MRRKGNDDDDVEVEVEVDDGGFVTLEEAAKQTTDGGRKQKLS